MKLSSKDYAIHNQMEDLADLAIQQVLSEDKSACDCSLCRIDMKCMILNRMAADYRPVEELEKQERKIRLEDVEREVFNQLMVEAYSALARVKSGPRHDGSRSSLHNSLEELARIGLQEILIREEQELNFYQISQIMALVLNDLKPRYTTTLKGSAFSRTVEIDPDFLARIYSSVFNALNVLGLKKKA